MGGQRLPWSYLSDEAILDLRERCGSYREAAKELEDILGRPVTHTTFYDEVNRRGLTGEWNSIEPNKSGFPEPPIKPLPQYSGPWPSEWQVSTSFTAEEPDYPTREEALEEENKKLRGDLNRYIKRDRLEARLADVMRSEVRAHINKPTLPQGYTPQPRGSVEAEHSFNLLLSDAHYSEVVTYEETGGLNEYNTAIHDERMLRIFDALCSFQENRPYPIKHINVFMLGDMQSGDIHDELSITNEMPQTKAIVKYSRYMIDWLEMLAHRFMTVKVTGISGNHPRLTKKPFSKQGYNTGDWLAYESIRTGLEDHPAFSFDIPEANQHDVLLDGGWRVLMLHGQGIKSMGSSPENAVQRRVKELQLQYAQGGKPIDYLVLGHWHRASSLSGVGVKTYINGSIKGVDEYSLDRFGSGQDPEQLLLTTHPDWGVTDVSYINLTPQVPNRKKALV